ncbi:MAG TPA: UDP-N-acetylmuramate--alanine ligase, partial [Burkholderiales bacterium]|nr:UDP-N-acetylmuramate--alanine ligase [Burkholderiales bacterium]
MAEDGIDDFALAKRKALRQLGIDGRVALPSNDEIENQLRAYRALYQQGEHESRVTSLRRAAVAAMKALARFRPYLTGSVLTGTAGPYAEVELQLFPDDSRQV